MTIDLDLIVVQQLLDDTGAAAGDLIRHFIGDIRAKLDDLSNLPHEPDMTACVLHAHSLKSLSLTCGLIGIADKAYALELACRDGNTELAAAHFSGISKRLEPAIDALCAFVDERTPPQEP